MAIVRWRPYRPMTSLQHEVNKLFDDFFTRRESDEPESAGVAWAPRVDIHEAKDKFVVEAEVPGVKKDDIKLSVHDDRLSIEGERKYEHEEHEDCDCHRQERFYGKFHRSFTLPTAVDATKIVAKYNDGVLNIELPKKEAALPKEIEISVK
jgi:HSP20 family protein